METAALLLLLMAGDFSSDAREFDLQSYLDGEYSECLDDFGQPVTINAVVFHDFGGDGMEEIVATASSCHTGTAGPDIHAVYELVSPIEVRELPIDRAVEFAGEDLYHGLVGNRNYFFYVNSRGHLVKEFHDESERPEGQSPLVLYYSWNGREFKLSQVDRNVRGCCPREPPGRVE